LHFEENPKSNPVTLRHDLMLSLKMALPDALEIFASLNLLSFFDLKLSTDLPTVPCLELSSPYSLGHSV
jgi:hypothetical protein